MAALSDNLQEKLYKIFGNLEQVEEFLKFIGSEISSGGNGSGTGSGGLVVTQVSDGHLLTRAERGLVYPDADGVTVLLPAAPSVGDTYVFAPFLKTGFQIDPNGNGIFGQISPYDLFYAYNLVDVTPNGAILLQIVFDTSGNWIRGSSSTLARKRVPAITDIFKAGEIVAVDSGETDNPVDFYLARLNAVETPLNRQDPKFFTKLGLKFATKTLAGRPAPFLARVTGFADGYLDPLSGSDQNSLILQIGNVPFNVVDSSEPKVLTGKDTGLWFASSGNVNFLLPTAPQDGQTYWFMVGPSGSGALLDGQGHSFIGLSGNNPVATAQLRYGAVWKVVYSSNAAAWIITERLGVPDYSPDANYFHGDRVVGDGMGHTYVAVSEGSQQVGFPLTDRSAWRRDNFSPVNSVESPFFANSRLYMGGTLNGVAMQNATLLQAVSGATASVINVRSDPDCIDVYLVTGTFNTTNIVTGTNPDLSTFTFTPSQPLVSAWQFSAGVAIAVLVVEAIAPAPALLTMRVSSATLAANQCRHVSVLSQIETPAADGHTDLIAQYVWD